MPIKNPVVPGVSCPGSSGSGTKPESGLLLAKENDDFLDLIGSSGDSGAMVKNPSLRLWSRKADGIFVFSLFGLLARPILREANPFGDAFLLVGAVPEDGEGTRSLRPLTVLHSVTAERLVVMLLIFTVWKTVSC